MPKNKKKPPAPQVARVKPLHPREPEGDEAKEGAVQSTRSTIWHNVSSIAILALLAITVLLLALDISLNAPKGITQGTEPVQEEPAGITEVSEAHEHAWEPVYATVHREAVTDAIEHPAEYEQVTAYHTICSACGEQIDNEVQAHEEETGHLSYSTNVPVMEQRIAKDAWVEPFVVEEAWTEQVCDHYVCETCGELLYGTQDGDASQAPVPTGSQAS